MTNFNKEKEEIIYELLLSLNKGCSCYASERVDVAIEQYNKLVEKKIITEWCEHNWKTEDLDYDSEKKIYRRRCVCPKCGEEEFLFSV